MVGHRRRGHRGFTYIGMLIVVAILGVGLGATGVLFHQQAQREKERQLLFAGDQIRRAIGLYYERSPGGGKQFPRRLEDLLQDPRQPALQRYLRRLYQDPMTGSQDWVPIPAPDGGILGVHSASTARPLKVAGFAPADEGFRDKGSYAEWKFVHAVGSAPP